MTIKTTLPKFSGASGAAFLLTWPAKANKAISIPGATVVIRAETPSITIELNGALPANTTVHDHAWDEIQKFLDVQSVIYGAESLSTKDGDRQYITWERNPSNGKYKVNIIDTGDIAWQVDARGTTTPSSPPQPIQSIAHHDSFRYFRLSQTTDDLFDAYRNLYLALECLLSSISPLNKQIKESEINWIQRVTQHQLGASYTSATKALLRRIYKKARCPLFHAKINENFHLPHGKSRDSIVSSLAELQSLVLSLYSTTQGSNIRNVGASMSQQAQDAMVDSMPPINELRFNGVRKCVQMPATMKVMSNPRWFRNKWLRIRTAAPAGLSKVSSIDAFSYGTHCISLDFKESIPLKNVSSFEIEIRHLVFSTRSLKPKYRT